MILGDTAVEMIPKRSTIRAVEAKTNFQPMDDLDLFYNSGVEEAVESVDSMPGLDIVFCRECCNYVRFKLFTENRELSEAHNFCKRTFVEHEEDWFCADGDRGTEE